MNPESRFEGDDLRKTDPKFQSPRFAQYLEAVQLLDRFAQENYGKRVIHLAPRWVLDQPGVAGALWGARHPGQLDPVGDGWGGRWTTTRFVRSIELFIARSRTLWDRNSWRRPPASGPFLNFKARLVL